MCNEDNRYQASLNATEVRIVDKIEFHGIWAGRDLFGEDSHTVCFYSEGKHINTNILSAYQMYNILEFDGFCYPPTGHKMVRVMLTMDVKDELARMSRTAPDFLKARERQVLRLNGIQNFKASMELPPEAKDFLQFGWEIGPLEG